VQTVTRKLWFSAGHRLLNHEGACANIHGHNYILYVTAQADKLDTVGRVIDFSVLKDKFGNWIDMYWDHAMLFNVDDKMCNGMLYQYAPTMGMKNYGCPFNPTAENMAEFLLNTISPQLMKGTGVEVIEIKLFETENCYAIASRTKKGPDTLPTHDLEPLNAL